MLKKYIFRQHKLINGFAIGCIFLLTLPLPASFGSKKPAVLEPVVMQLKWQHQFQFAGYYAAQEKGYYRDAGLDVSIRALAQGRNAIDTVLSGKADYGVGNAEMLLRRLQGDPLVVLAAIFQHSSFELLTLKDSHITTPHDLIGKRVLVGKSGEAIFNAMLRNEGLSIDDIIRIPYSEWRVDALSRDICDAFGAYSTNEPFFFHEHGIAIGRLNPRSYGIDFYEDMLFTTESITKKFPDRTRRFRDASLRGWRYAMDHPDEIIEILISKYNCNKTRAHLQHEAAEVRKLILPDLVEIGHINPGRCKSMASEFVALGLAETDDITGLVFSPGTGDLASIQILSYILSAVAGLALLLLLFSHVWARSLRRAVRAKTDELESGERQFRAIFDSMPLYLALWKYENGGFILYNVNSASVSLSNATIHEFIGTPLTTFYKDTPWISETITTCFNIQETLQKEKIYTLRTTGEKRYMAFHFAYVPDAYVLVVSEDITERKNIEAQLKQNEIELEQALNATTHGLWSWNFKTDTLSFSRRYYTMLGYAPDEFPATYENWVNLIHRDDRETAIATAGQYLKNKSDYYENEFRLRTKSGDYRWIRAHGRIVERDANGDAIYMIGDHEDITERKLTEASRRQSEELFSKAFYAGPLIMVISEIETGKLIEVNDNFIKATGYDRREAVGKTSLDISLFSKSDREMLMNALQTDGRIRDLDLRVRIKDGSSIFCKYYGEIINIGGRKRLLTIAEDISVQKRAEDSLKASEKRFRQFFSNAGAYCYMVSPDGIIIEVNPTVSEKLGYASRELVGQPILNLYTDDSRDKARHLLHSWKTTGRIRDAELTIKAKNGDIRWIILNADAVKDNSGKIVHSTSIQIDITERKAAEDALKESETAQRAVMENLPAGIIVVDAVTRRIEHANTAAASLFGAPQDEIIDHVCHDYICPASEKECPICDLGHTIDNSEREIICKDGRRLPVLKSVKQLTMKGEEKLLECFVDISDRRKAETALQENRDRLLQAQKLAKIGYWDWYRDTGEMKWSEEVYQIFGRNPKDCQPTVSNFESMIHPDDLQDFILERNRKLAHKQDVDIEHRIIRPDGEIRWVREVAKVFLSDTGSIFHLMGTVQDITRQKIADEEKMMLEKRLQQTQKMEAIGTLAGGIAHDFNNILFPLLGYAEMLRDDLPDSSPLQDYVGEILAASKRAGELVQQILSFSRQTRQDMQPIKLQAIIKETLKLLRSTIPATIDINRNISTACGPVLADPTQIHQIIMNLATNALHAMEDTGGTLTIDLRQADLTSTPCHETELPPGSYAILSISDTGTGIEAGLMEKIFTPYFTTKPINKGTGLGLSVVQGIVNSHNGGIHIESKPDKGTRIDIYLPLIQRKAADSVSDSSEPAAGGTETILLVDDEVRILKMQQRILERLGYTVTIETGSLAALETFNDRPQSFDLVITDMTMPNMTGAQLAREMKRVRADIPVILCTGYSEHIDAERCKALGIQGYVMKPIVKKEMAAVIRSVLDEKGKPA